MKVKNKSFFLAELLNMFFDQFIVKNGTIQIFIQTFVK